MIIDFHTHCFPDKVAAKAIPSLSATSDTQAYSDGTAAGLAKSSKASGVDLAVIMPVVTAPKQIATINRVAIETNNTWQETGLLSFGGMHPDCENYREVLRNLAREGIKGIKLHPVYQQCALDDIRFLRIIDCACENGLWVLTHAGYDIGFPGEEFSSVTAIKNMLDTLHPDRMILAHMGGWGQWDEVEEKLLSYPVWLDTSTSLITLEHFEADPSKRKFPPEQEQMQIEQFVRMVRTIGTDRVLMGSDLPWTRQTDAIAAIRQSGLNQIEIEQILGGNAEKILFG